MAGCHRPTSALIREVAQEKRVVSFADSKATSAAYYLGVSAGEFYAIPDATIGSIGGYIAILDESRKFEMEGLAVELFASGNLKAAGLKGTSLTDEQRMFFHDLIDRTIGAFMATVADNRPGLTIQDVADLEAGFYDADLAEKLGLIDGTFLTLDHLLAWLIDTKPVI